MYGYTSGSPYQLITIPGINEMLFTNDMSFQITIRVLKNVISLAAGAFWCNEVWIEIYYNAVCETHTMWACLDNFVWKQGPYFFVAAQTG